MRYSVQLLRPRWQDVSERAPDRQRVLRGSALIAAEFWPSASQSEGCADSVSVLHHISSELRQRRPERLRPLLDAAARQHGSRWFELQEKPTNKRPILCRCTNGIQGEEGNGSRTTSGGAG